MVPVKFEDKTALYNVSCVLHIQVDLILFLVCNTSVVYIGCTVGFIYD